MDYPFDSILINSREVDLAEIRSGGAIADSPFEEETFQFIRSWLNEEDSFTMTTSGSTGPPKPITVTRSQMQASASATIRALELERGQTSLLCLDPRYIAGKMMIVRSFVGKMKLVAVEPSANPLQSVEKGHQIDFAALVPYQLHRILQDPRKILLNSIRTVIIGGAPISAEILPQLSGYSTRFYATYGMTETVSHIALKELTNSDVNHSFHVLPGIAVETDTRGCLKIKANYLDEEIITNDLVELTSENSFKWIGRFDNIINTGGVKVYPELVESRLESVKSILNLHDRFIISSLNDPGLGERIICVIEKKQIDSTLKEQLLSKISDYVTKYEAPKAILCLSPFPETTSGKIDRQAIRKLLNNPP